MVHYKCYLLSLRPQSFYLGDTRQEFQKIVFVQAAHSELLFNWNLKPVQFRDLKFWIFYTPVSHELLRLAIMNFLSSFYKFVLGLLFLAKLVFTKKYGIVEITSQSYQDMVIDGEKDAWIVAVKGAGKISRAEWQDLEVNLRGLFVRVGIIDPEKDGAFMKKKVKPLFKFPCKYF